MASLAWLVALLAALLGLAVVWQYGKALPWLQDRRERVKTWILERRVRFEWAGVTLRIMFYNTQIIVKYTELQDVEWPSPFNEYVSILSGIALDVTTLLPGLECSPTWSGYTSLLLWTILPIALVVGSAGVAAANAHSKGQDVTSAAVTTTDRALAVLSLIHTLICVQIFQTFDCDDFDAGDEEGPRI